MGNENKPNFINDEKDYLYTIDYDNNIMRISNYGFKLLIKMGLSFIGIAFILGLIVGWWLL